MSTELDPLLQAASSAEARYRESLSKDHLEEAIDVWGRVISHQAFTSVRLEIRRATLETVSILLIENDDSPRASTLLRRAEAEALRELLSLNLNHALALIVPTVPHDVPGYPRLVTSDDMLAFDRVHQGLNLIGCEDSVTLFVRDSPIEPADDRNLVLFCSRKRNKYTRAFLDKKLIPFDFVESGDPGGGTRWDITGSDGSAYPSPSYDDEADLQNRLRQGGAGFVRGEFADHAIVALSSNPWSDDGAKILLLAGARAFGTWGAAEFICAEAKSLVAQTDGRPFAAVVKIRATGSCTEYDEGGGHVSYSTVVDTIRGHDLVRLVTL